MYKDSTIKYITETFSKLSEANISIYKISQILDEPEPTMHNIFNQRAKYSEERVIDIMNKVNEHLFEFQNNDSLLDGSLNNPVQDPDLFIKLYALGLDSKAFTPDEKYKLAVAYKKLTDSKNKIKNDNE